MVTRVVMPPLQMTPTVPWVARRKIDRKRRSKQHQKPRKARLIPSSDQRAVLVAGAEERDGCKRAAPITRREGGGGRGGKVDKAAGGCAGRLPSVARRGLVRRRVVRLSPRVTDDSIAPLTGEHIRLEVGGSLADATALQLVADLFSVLVKAPDFSSL